MNKIKAIILVSIVIFLFGWVSYSETHYDRRATVEAVNGCLVTVVDDCGYVWEFEGTNYYPGENLILKMHTRFTDSIITDDTIENVIKE